MTDDLEEASPAAAGSDEPDDIGEGNREALVSRLRRGLRWPRRIARSLPSISPRQLVGTILVFLGLVLLLSIVRVPSTRISLNVTSETMALVAGRPGRTSEILLDDVEWTGGFASARLPDGSELETDYIDVSGGFVTLAPISLREGATMIIQSGGGSGRYDLFVRDAEGALELVLPPGASVGTGDEWPRVFDDEYGASLRIAGLDRPFHLVGSAVRRERLIDAMPVRSLAFWREETRREVATPLSTLREGLLVLEDIAGRRVQLREGEPLRLGALEGMVRSLVLEDGLVRVQLDARVTDVRSGYGTEARSLMPSLLERIVNIPQVKALLAVLAILLGSFFPRWNRKQES